jgi:penicillin-binding protein 1A
MSTSFHPFAPGGGSNPAQRPPPSRAPAPVTSLGWRIVRVAGVFAFVFGLVLAYGAYSWLDELGVFSTDAKRFDVITNYRPSDNSLVYDRDGKKVGEFFSSYQVYVPLKKLPKTLVDAILAIEDRSFYAHNGFDPKGIARAVMSRVRGERQVQGASTLTQQVVRNFLLPKERTMQRKVQEIALAYHLEQVVSKDKILEIYANTMFLGNGAYGVGAAAARYFGKTVGELTTEEAALIAGLFQSPSRFNPVRYPERAKARQRQVLKAMAQSGELTEAQAKELGKRKLAYKEYKPLNTQFAPYFIDYVRGEAERLLAGKKATLDGQGLRIYTTLDTKLQRLAEESVAESGKLLDQAQDRTAAVKGPKGKPVRATLETALLSTDPKTGEILAMVGGRDYQKSKFNRTWQALRSPGSAFKPIVYATALAKKWKWSDVIYVSPVTVNNYRPHTPDADFLTETTLLRAFYRSMNTPTIELGQKVGLGPVIELAKKVGIRSPIKEEFGSMLGSSDVTMMDLARMYGTYANQGVMVEPIAITKITDQTGKVLYTAPARDARSARAMTPQTAYLLTQGMRAVLAMGTGYTSAHLSGVAAGKTGTSNDSADNWFCGYGNDLASIVWVGTDEHASIYGDVTGGKLALPIWDKFMTKAFRVREPRPFPAPPGIVTTVVHPKYGSRSPAGVRMYFQRGNEPPADASALEVLSQSEGAGYRDVFTH